MLQDKVAEIVAGLQKQFGPGSVMALGADSSIKIANVETVPTGSIKLNRVLGCGGFPKNRITEIFGPESGGKTTLTLTAIAEAQRDGGIAAFIDLEHSLDLNYAKKLGVDIENLLISQPDNGEEAVEIALALAKIGVDILVIDSTAGLVPVAEITGDMTDANMGATGRLTSKMCRVLVPSISNTAVVLISQIRMKLGMVFGSPEVTTGGNAPKFWASVRLDVRIKERTEKYNDIKIKVIKNKAGGTPYKEIETRIVFGVGIDSNLEILEMAVEKEIIERNGSWYSFKGEKIANGKDAASEFLKANNDICMEILNVIDKD